MGDNGDMKPSWRRFAAALTAVSLVFGTASVSAQSAAEKETARGLMKDGRARREKGDHKGALESFTGADGIMKLPTTGLEVGRSQTDLGLLVEARDTFLRVARQPEQAGEPAGFKDARKEAADQANKLESRIPSLKLTVSGVPSGQTATVNVDGVDLSPAALAAAIKLNPGSHHVSATAKGAVKQEVDVELKEGETKEASIELKAEAAAPIETPVKPEPTPEPPPPPKGTSPLVYAGFGVAGVGIVVGSVTGFLAMSKTKAAKEDCDGTRCPPSTHDDLGSARTMATVSTVSFVVAAVGAGIGIYGLFASKDSGEPPKTSLGPLRSFQPVVGLGTIGLTGSF